MKEPERILVVDDEYGIRESCRKVLTAEGYIVETANDGLEGLERFSGGENFACALIDLKMPRMGGLELIDKIHHLDEDVCILVITAYSTIETAVEATKRGSYGYIPKPFTPEELALPVKNGLEKRALAIEAKELRKEREKRLLEVAFERSKCRTIIDCMTDGVMVVNWEKEVVLGNAALSKIFPSFMGMTFPCPLSSVDLGPLRENLEETVHASSIPEIVSREIKVSSSTYMVNTSPVLNADGLVLGAVAVLRDITEIKELETAKTMFISMVAHELKSPLGVIEGYLDLVLHEPEGGNREKSEEMLERSLLRVKILRELIDELMNLRAIETGRFTIARSKLDLVELVREAMKSSQEKAIAKNIDLIEDPSIKRTWTSILADRDAMKRVIMNLIDNAVKYTHEGGHVLVDLSKNESHITISVKDDGIGMSPEDKERIFEEFFRVRN